MTTIKEIKDFIRAASKDDPYLAFEDVMAEFDGKVVSEEMYDQRRWMTTYEYVGKIGDQYFRMYRDHGSTENQEDTDLADSMDSLVEVEPVEVKTIQYRVKK